MMFRFEPHAPDMQERPTPVVCNAMNTVAALQRKKKVHAGHRGHECKDRSLQRWEPRHLIWTHSLC